MRCTASVWRTATTRSGCTDPTEETVMGASGRRYELLDRRAPESVPSPVLHDRLGRPSAVVMACLPGQPLGGHQLSPAQFAQLRECQQVLHGITPRETGVVIPAATGAARNILPRTRRDGAALGSGIGRRSDWPGSWANLKRSRLTPPPIFPKPYSY
jgi:hypothetical protein